MGNPNDVSRIVNLEADAVLTLLQTSPLGLSNAEADKRVQINGKNQLPKVAAFSLWRLFFRQFTHLMALLLWAVGFLAFAVDMPELGWATWFVILVNALFSFWQEYRADRALTALLTMLPQKAKVYREGKLAQILSEDIAVGDVLVVEAGDHVSADARLIEAEDLMVDVSLLTGESMPVTCDAAAIAEWPVKSVMAPNLLFAGSMATVGRGVAVVFATGKHSELGKIAQFTARVVREKSSLELQVQRIVRLITLLALLMGALVFALAVLVLGIDLKTSFVFCIGIIVANVPEGLLPTVSLSLAVGVQRMARQNALVRKLSAVESLCAASVICTDKTGTLTMNEVTVKRIWLPDHEAEVSGTGYEKAGAVSGTSPDATQQIELLLTIGIMSSETDLETEERDSHLWRIVGDPTEGALLVAATKNGQDIVSVRSAFSVQTTRQFDSKRRMMSALGINLCSSLFRPGAAVVFAKGAPLETLQHCRYIRKAAGVAALSADERQEITQANDRLSLEGYRVLALAYGDDANAAQPGEHDLIFVGLAAMIDPPRPEVAEAIRLCRQAGICVTMITGDYGLTAEAIARQIGLVEGGAQIIAGAELDGMSREGLADLLRPGNPMIFSRATPEHKLKIVEAYQSCGHIVAVTGDGVNDAPALKAADIGIAMGRGGTDVAREVADIVLLDDNFATIVKAIEQGRAIYENIRKFMTYILASNIPEIVPFLAMVFLKIPPALTILQILAIDIGTDMAPALALGAEPPEPGILRRRPGDYTKNLLDKTLLLRSYGFLGMIEAVLSMGAFFLVWSQQGYSLPDLQRITPLIFSGMADAAAQETYRQSTTMSLSAIIACQVGNLFVCRSEREPFWRFSLATNVLIWAGIGTEIVIAGSLIYLPVFSAIFATQPLDWTNLFWLALCPLILVVLEECRRFLFQRFVHNRMSA